MAGVSVPVGSVPVIQTPGVSSRELSVSVITGHVLKQGIIQTQRVLNISLL